MSQQDYERLKLISMFEEDNAAYHKYMLQVRQKNVTDNFNRGALTLQKDGSYVLNEKYVPHPLLSVHEELMKKQQALEEQNC
jgi:hypothetical protein